MQHVMGLSLTWRQELLAEQAASGRADCRKPASCPKQPNLVCRQAEHTMQPAMWWTQPRARPVP